MKALQAHGHLRGERVLYFRDQNTGRQRPTIPKVLCMRAIKIEKLAALPITQRLHVLYMHLAQRAKHQAIELLDERANVVAAEMAAAAEG